MHRLVIRPSRVGDMAAVRRIYAYHVRKGLGSFEEKAPPARELKRRRRQVLNQGLPYFVAEIDGTVIGYCYATPYRERSAYRYTLENSVYVDPRVRRRGVGHALLSAVIEQCEAGGWRQMIAVIGDSGNAASIGLHKNLGFRTAGTLRSVGFKLGRWVDSVLMQRKLGSGDRTSPL